MNEYQNQYAIYKNITFRKDGPDAASLEAKLNETEKKLAIAKK